MTMIRKFGLVAALALALFAIVGMFALSADAQTPPAPKATATASAAPPKVPAPAKTGNAGLHAGDVVTPLQAATPGTSSVAALGVASALVASIVAAIKGVYPGTIPSKFVPLLVTIVAIGVFVLALTSGRLVEPDWFSRVVDAVALILGAMGVREGASAVTGGGVSTALPTNAGS